MGGEKVEEREVGRERKGDGCGRDKGRGKEKNGEMCGREGKEHAG